MATCQICTREMKLAQGCAAKHIIIDGKRFERSTEHYNEPAGICYDCCATHGQIHHYGCDVERCPACGLQLMSCGCVVTDVIQ